MLIREERPTDRAAVRRINELAFGRPGEANLVEALHAAGAVTLALVAEDEDGELAGHILFSPVTIDGAPRAIGLAPLAVLPGRQKTGIGSALAREGIARLARAGERAVIVLGHPEYYPRFGFEPASRFGVAWEHPCDEGAFMAMELVKGALAPGGIVRYRPEFAAV